MDEYELMKKIYLDKDMNIIIDDFTNIKRRSDFETKSNISFSSANKQEHDTTLTCVTEREDVKKSDFIEVAENRHLIKNIQEKVINVYFR